MLKWSSPRDIFIRSEFRRKKIPQYVFQWTSTIARDSLLLPTAVNDCCMVQCNNPFLVTWKWTNKNFFFNIIGPYLSPSHLHTPPFFLFPVSRKMKKGKEENFFSVNYFLCKCNIHFVRLECCFVRYLRGTEIIRWLWTWSCGNLMLTVLDLEIYWWIFRIEEV